MAEQIKTRMTADEFLKLPETNLPVQLLDGWVIRLDTPDLRHQDVIGNAAILFWERAKELGGKLMSPLSMCTLMS